MGRLIRKTFGKECLIVSIMPCYDKKLEAIRFDMEEKVKEVDLTIATIEMIEILKKYDENFINKGVPENE